MVDQVMAGVIIGEKTTGQSGGWWYTGEKHIKLICVAGKQPAMEHYNIYQIIFRSLQNIWIERLWRDVCKETLEMVRQIFFYLEEIGLLDMDSRIHHICLYLVF